MADDSAGRQVKRDLKTAILSKRLARGELEIKVEFKEAPNEEPTPEDLQRLERRRRQNREAARRHRMKKGIVSKLTKEKWQKYRLKNTELQKEIKQLTEQKKTLTDIVHEHVNSSQCLHRLHLNQHRETGHGKQPDMTCLNNSNREDVMVQVTGNMQQELRHGENTDMTYITTSTSPEAVDPLVVNTQPEPCYSENRNITDEDNSSAVEDTVTEAAHTHGSFDRQFSIPSDALACLEEHVGARDVTDSSFLPFGNYSELVEGGTPEHGVNPATPVSAGFQVLSSANSVDDNVRFFGDEFDSGAETWEQKGEQVENMEGGETHGVQNHVVEDAIPQSQTINNDATPLPNFDELLYSYD